MQPTTDQQINTRTGSRLQGKTALVTGGRQGIGRAIVSRFLDEGALVMTCGRGSRPAGLPKSVLWQTADISSSKDVVCLKDAFSTILGNMGILVNNAGVQLEKTILETTDSDWDTIMDTNAKGTFLVCREMIPIMEQGGSIINMGSISGSYADAGLALYNASKGFIHSLTRSIAIDHGAAIRCNAISPGWIMTEMADAAFATAKNPHKAKQDALLRHPVGRLGKPEDVAHLAVWLASDEAGFASGQCYFLDGGLTAASPLNPSLF